MPGRSKSKPPPQKETTKKTVPDDAYLDLLDETIKSYAFHQNPIIKIAQLCRALEYISKMILTMTGEIDFKIGQHQKKDLPGGTHSHNP